MRDVINKAITKVVVELLPILLTKNKLIYTVNTWLENNKSRVLCKEEKFGHILYGQSGLPTFVFSRSKQSGAIYDNDRLFLLSLIAKIESKSLYGSYEDYMDSDECYAKLILASITKELLSV